jgi:Uma2 family endonuclease
MADGFQLSPDKATAMSRRSFSVAELDVMFDAGIFSREETIELIDGDIVPMNFQLLPHAVLKSRLARRLSQLLLDTFDVVVEASTTLNELTLVDPDIVVTERLVIERRYIRNTEVLLAIEVADTSLSYDLGIKADLYARASVRELWVVDLNGGQTWVHREPGETGFATVVNVSFETLLVPLLDDTIGIVVAELLT